MSQDKCLGFNAPESVKVFADGAFFQQSHYKSLAEEMD